MAAVFRRDVIDMTKRIERILSVAALHDAAHVSTAVSDSVRYIESYQYDVKDFPICRFEIQVRYDNGDSIVGTFNSKEDAIQFLRGQELQLHAKK